MNHEDRAEAGVQIALMTPIGTGFPRSNRRAEQQFIADRAAIRLPIVRPPGQYDRLAAEALTIEEAHQVASVL
jgi:hypothetical protein